MGNRGAGEADVSRQLMQLFLLFFLAFFCREVGEGIMLCSLSRRAPEVSFCRAEGVMSSYWRAERLLRAIFGAVKGLEFYWRAEGVVNTYWRAERVMSSYWRAEGVVSSN